jgi:hypothetical protein
MPEKPTTAQLNYIRILANRTGQTFTYPMTRAQASVEIARLKAAPRSSRLEVAIEHKQIADAIAAGPEDGARVRRGEVVGHGASARWVHNHGPEPDQGTPAGRLTPTVGELIELARYTTGPGERVVYGQRIDGIVRVTDRPAAMATKDNRSYIVERGLTSQQELDALVRDYIAAAHRLHAVPMSVSPFDRYLAVMP